MFLFFYPALHVHFTQYENISFFFFFFFCHLLFSVPLPVLSVWLRLCYWQQALIYVSLCQHLDSTVAAYWLCCLVFFVQLVTKGPSPQVS